MKKHLLSLSLFLLICLFPAASAHAEELTPEIKCSGNQKVSSMTDGSYNTAAKFSSGDTVTITAKDGKKIQAIYIQWDARVTAYTMTADEKKLSCGTYGFLHEYIPLDTPCDTLTITIPADKMKICNIRIFDSKDVPSDVQVWNPPCDRADILMFPSHADDEVLYFGGVIPTYAAECGARVQVVYLTEFWSTSQDVREHEKLDGLWTDGDRIYPVCLDYPDKYCKDLDAAKKIYSEEDMLNKMTDVIRRFQPQVIVTHDFAGEYGHGLHRLNAKVTAEALEKAADKTFCTDTEIFAEKGAWDVPKAYFHLYKENAIEMNLRVPLASMNGQTALEAAIAAYDKHVSQHKWSFYVSDNYKHSCAKFGLYRTKVGTDTENSMIEHIVLYEEQERLEREEQERLEQERLEQERLEQERLESERAESERIEQEKKKKEHDKQLAELQQKLKDSQASLQRSVILMICVMVLLLVLMIAFMVILWKRMRQPHHHHKR